jgi:hypothetical protein
MKKLKKLSIVIFEPPYGKEHPEAYKDGLIKIGESVLYLGDIPNAPGHCAVIKHSGEVVWLTHPQDFREATEEEV